VHSRAATLQQSAAVRPRTSSAACAAATLERSATDDRRPLVIGLALVLALQVVDVITTRVALAHGGSEGNPFARALLTTPGLVETVKFSVAGFALWRGTRGNVSAGRLAGAWAVVGFYAAVQVSNLLALVRLHAV
jgi:uncharacterized protein DUF5658